MHILLLTQLFQPEPNVIKGLDLAKALVGMGHTVEVLTGFPNYPGGKVYKGYRIQSWMREVMDGIPVTRVAMYPSHNRSGLKRFFCYASFAFTASVLGPFLVKRPDVIHICQGPATLVYPAMVIRFLCGAPYVLDIADIWPESVFASGMYHLPVGRSLLQFWCDLTYCFARKIVSQSHGAKEVLLARRVQSDKIEVIHNWCDPAIPWIVDPDILAHKPTGFDSTFNVVYAGTMGPVQALEPVIKAALQLQNTRPTLRVFLVGAGIEVDRLKALAKTLQVSNVVFVPRQPPAGLVKYIAAADAVLVHLKDDPLSRIGIPSKTQAYLASGKSILMAVKGEAADMVQKAKAGVICEPENVESIAKGITALMDMSPEERKTMGANGRRYYEQELAFEVGYKRLEAVFRVADRNSS